jgi:hypothetical protein
MINPPSASELGEIEQSLLYPLPSPLPAAQASEKAKYVSHATCIASDDPRLAR